MKRLRIENLGPLRRADVTLGDLTVLVGPQASGKSLFVQTYKAICDAQSIRSDLRSYGFDWKTSDDPIGSFCASYYGGGTEHLPKENTRLIRDERDITFKNIVSPRGRDTESVYFIPAQRVLILQDGWPRPFLGYQVSEPYSIKRFSESIRLLMERGLDRAKTVFPQPKRLKADLRTLLMDGIYSGGTLNIEAEGARKRIVLKPGSRTSLAMGAWSAGQREFTPLLLGLYWLMPGTQKPKQDRVEVVVIEEPEMGLHPKAIVSFGLLVLELLHRGYRVIVSTHSPVFLDVVWAVRQLSGVRRNHARAALKKIFGLRTLTAPLQQVFENALDAEYRTYFFERKPRGVVVKEISTLDPGDEDPHVSGWGGLSGFSGEIAEAVGEAMSK